MKTSPSWSFATCPTNPARAPNAAKSGGRVRSRTAARFTSRAHSAVEPCSFVGVDQPHRSFGKPLFGEEGVVGSGDDVDNGVADSEHVEASVGQEDILREGKRGEALAAATDDQPPGQRPGLDKVPCRRFAVSARASSRSPPIGSLGRHLPRWRYRLRRAGRRRAAGRPAPATPPPHDSGLDRVMGRTPGDVAEQFGEPDQDSGTGRRASSSSRQRACVLDVISIARQGGARTRRDHGSMPGCRMDAAGPGVVHRGDQPAAGGALAVHSARTASSASSARRAICSPAKPAGSSRDSAHAAARTTARHRPSASAAARAPRCRCFLRR